tara:strand:+ start:1568 stop:1924 length:357 start_codon:yes stop_codon:yes gene_type:complete
MDNEEENSDDKEENMDNLIEITRPTTRSSQRRSAIKPAPRQRKSIALCKECFISIYNHADINQCHTCKCIYCETCWNKNSHCIHCSLRLNKDGYVETRINSKFQFFRKIVTCLCCIRK